MVYYSFEFEVMRELRNESELGSGAHQVVFTEYPGIVDGFSDVGQHQPVPDDNYRNFTGRVACYAFWVHDCNPWN